MIGPLVGHAFITAINLYAEMSGVGGAPAALPQGLAPLDGILVPTFGAYDLAATLLLPFVAIRIVAAEKESGALKLLLQLPQALTTKVTVKGIVLAGGWLLAWLPGLVTVALWKSYGGHLSIAETLNLFLGHLLRAFVSAGIAVAAGAVLESAASAAIVTLGFTVGTWALDFIAAGRGGLLQQLATYTPTAALRFFEQGLLRLSTVLVMLAIGVAGFAVAAIWLHTGRPLRVRALATALVLVILTAVTVAAANTRLSWDVSENRRNSFSATDEAKLRRIQNPLRITVFLAAEDPRLTDFEQNVLKKLRRVLPHLDVEYAAGSRSGLFETAEDHYGEIWYEMSGQRRIDRSTIEQVVLEQIYKLANIALPESGPENEYPGYPLSATPRGAPWIFYVVWPLVIILTWWFIRR
jgi:ABC-type transport system involved in multi-copper enzyme maturation permease subunit